MGYFLPGNRKNDKIKVWHVTLGRPLILPCPRHTKTHPVKYYWGNAGPPPKHIQQNKRINVLDNGVLHVSSLRQEDIDDFNQNYHGISCIMASKGHTISSVKIAFRADEGKITLKNRVQNITILLRSQNNFQVQSTSETLSAVINLKALTKNEFSH